MRGRLCVVGAGPIGLEAALGGLEAGLDVTILERDVPGASLLSAGSTRLFSPTGMNLSARAKRLLEGRLPPPESLLTARDFVSRVVEPLAGSAPLAGRILTGHRVVSIARARMTRYDFPGHPLRAERPFRILAEANGGEVVLEADVVIDASGVYGRGSFFGPGGMPAKGERALDTRITRQLGPLEERLPALAGRRVLLIGNGHSAANAILLLDHLASKAPGTRVTWAVRAPNARPCVEVAADPLPERGDVVARANALAESPPPHLAVERRVQVEEVVERSGELLVRFTNNKVITVDEIASFTGYRPDHSITAELAVEISPTGDGARGIQRALACVTDCLNVPAISPADLASGEPGFYFAGIKSYGRMPAFLLQSGLAQLETILAAIAEKRPR